MDADSVSDTHAQALARIGSPGAYFGLPALDRPLRGVKRGYLFLIAGPPAGGKTLLTTHLVLNNLGLKTAWFTPDESHGFAVAKLAGLALGKSVEEIERMVNTPKGMTQLSHFADDYLQKVYVSEVGAADQIQNELVRAARHWGGGPPDLLVWDYAELLDPGYPADVASKMDYFKKLIKSMNCHGVIIHQARKGSTNVMAGYADPSMDDLKEAGPAEAFQILYCRRTPVRNQVDKQRQELHPSSEVWILKNKAAPDKPQNGITFYLGQGGRLSSSEDIEPPTKKGLRFI